MMLKQRSRCVISKGTESKLECCGSKPALETISDKSTSLEFEALSLNSVDLREKYEVYLKHGCTFLVSYGGERP